MRTTTDLSQPTEPSISDAAIVDSSAFELYPPRPAFNSAWERLLAEGSTHELHTWIGDETASHQQQAIDVA